MQKSQSNIDFNVIYEAIVTTKNANNHINAAPMGVTFLDQQKLVLKPFTHTDTYKNISQFNEAVVNFTYNPELFVVCTLFQKELKKNDFYPLEASTIPALKEAKNNCLVIQKEAITNSQRINQKIITCDIQEKYFKSQFMPLYTRAFSSLLEILIHSTRIIAYSHQPSENQKRINYLLHQMKYHTTIIHKVTNKVSNYHKLLRKIENKLKEETQKSFLS